jgi:NAD(P)-dependent dehydrogenase (short-subunit alcohol dehydrogenase family)
MARSRYPVAGKAVLITGAARGIGAETARRLASAGAHVSLVGLEPDELQKVAAECGPEAIWFETDVTDADSLSAAVQGTVDQLGGIDVCMANAGIATGGLVHLTEPEALDRVIEVNLTGAVRTLRLCLPHIIESRGYILPVASLAAIAHSPLVAGYSATKAGIEAFADALRVEVKHLGVDVGVAYFGWIDTEMVRGADGRSPFKYMRDQLKGPMAKTFPASAAGAAVVRGIESRARVVTVPRWIRPLMVVRGALPILDGQALKLMPEVERISREEIAELGTERASAAVGAGGQADAERVAP